VIAHHSNDVPPLMLPKSNAHPHKGGLVTWKIERTKQNIIISRWRKDEWLPSGDRHLRRNNNPLTETGFPTWGLSNRPLPSSCKWKKRVRLFQSGEVALQTRKLYKYYIFIQFHSLERWWPTNDARWVWLNAIGFETLHRTCPATAKYVGGVCCAYVGNHY
jgi:hypothetical protein